MTKKTEPSTIPKGTSVMTGKPKNPVPEALIQRLTALFVSLDFVREAFIGQIYISAQEVRPHLFVQVRLSEGSERRLSEALPRFAAIAKELLALDEPMDIIPVPKDGPFRGGTRFYSKITPSVVEGQTTP
jgi:SseB protein C-terminal domain